MDALLIPRNPKYGWIPDLPDQRDFPYVRLAATIPILPAQIDLRSKCTPVEDQGQLGSCTACALVGDLEFLEQREFKKMFNFSRLFLYYNERVIRRSEATDSGASIRDGIKTLKKAGDCNEILWPYDIAKFAVKPSAEAYADATHHEITKYFRLQSLNEMKHTLSTGYPFVFGFAVYESFESPEVTKTGIVPMPGSDERVVGGHAIMAVGYDDSKEYFIFRNSWGSGWGDHGYGYMSYAYFTSTQLSSDFWTIRTVM